MTERDDLFASVDAAFDPAPDLLLDDPIAAPVPTPEILPVGFPLPRLTKFVPDPAKRAALYAAVDHGLAIDVTGREGLARADVALGAIRGYLAAVRREFDEPRRLAHELHAHVTGRLAEATASGDAALKTIGARVWTETRRLDALAAEDRRREQDLADAAERDRLARAADAAAANAAPASLVEDLRREAETATAPPVPVIDAAPLATTTPISTWRARPRGTPADAQPNPAISEMSPAQRDAVIDLLKDIVATGNNLTAIEVNWQALNARARADRQAFHVPGFEAFESGGARAKAARRTT